MSEETEEEVIECPQCENPIPMAELENKSEYTCPNCETVLELEGEEEETETEEASSEETESEDSPEEEASTEESEDEATAEETDAGESSEEAGTEVEETTEEAPTESAEAKPAKKKKTPRAKNPDEVKKYLDFIITQANGVQAPMVSEHFGVSERFSRLMIRNAIKMAEEQGMKVETKTGGKGKRKTYVIHG